MKYLFFIAQLVVFVAQVLGDPPDQGKQLDEWVKDLSRGKRRTDYPDEKEPRYRALRAFREMGPAASPAIPALTKLLHDDKTALEAATALVSIGPLSTDVFIKALESDNPEVRSRSAYALGELGTNAQSAVSFLLKLAQNTGENESVRIHAIWALGRIGKEAEKVVPVLILFLKDSNTNFRSTSAFAVGCFKQDAAKAISLLELLLNDKDRLVRHWAAQSLKQIKAE